MTFKAARLSKETYHPEQTEWLESGRNVTKASCWKCGRHNNLYNFLDWSDIAMATYPKVKSVTPLSEKQLFVTFTTGDTRVYDCAPLLSESSFYPLKDEAFFKNVHVDQTGYGVVWNDNVDLSESELWINGKAAATSN
ncbi:MAG: DUF2442 domain-containing protein [Desulfuromonadales bacterium]